MKNHPIEEHSEWRGMNSADAADRIEDASCALLKNGYCDHTGRVVKSYGVSIVTAADALGILATSGRTAIRSLHVFEGKVGENPNSRAVCVSGANLVRSKANDLRSRWDTITFPAEIDTPALNRPAAGVFRDSYFYHQNGKDFPFRLKCEEDDPSATLTLAAEVLGLKPPAFCMRYSSKTVGQARRFPPNVFTAYAVTFVYGTRGESGPSPVFQLALFTVDGTNDEIVFNKVPLGPTGCTARRIYRTKIGLAGALDQVAQQLVPHMIAGPKYEMFLVAEIPDNATTTWTDNYDNNAMDVNTRVPQPRPFPPIAQYQIMHLDRIFWAKLKEHPWVLGVMADPIRVNNATFTDYRVTISNTGSGTITFEKFVAGPGWTVDNAGAWSGVVSSYKTKTLRAIMLEILRQGSGAIIAGGGQIFTFDGVAAIMAGGIDVDRTYTFKEISQRSIYAPGNVYWFTALDDTANTQGTRWFPNRFMWCDITYPEQVSYLNSADLTRFGSKRVTNLLLMDSTLVIETDTDSWLISGTFIPDSFDVPSFEIHRSQASHGSICARPDATVTVPEIGTLMVAHDRLRRFRGESSSLVGIEIRDWFDRTMREPVTRSQLTMAYHAGEVFIALATDETR